MLKFLSCLPVILLFPVLSIGQIPNIEELRSLWGASEKVAQAIHGRMEMVDKNELRLLLHSGAASDDERLALTCLELLDWDFLSPKECQRFEELGLKFLGDESHEVDFESLRSIMGIRGVGRFLNICLDPKHASTLPNANMLAALHRQCRPIHMPQLAELSLRTELPFANEAYSNLLICAEYSDQYRRLVAKTILARNGDTDLPEKRSEALSGIPYELESTLRVILFAFNEDVQPNWVPQNSYSWAARWLRTTNPALGDFDFLGQLALSQKDLRISMAAIDVMASMESSEVEPFLWKLANNAEASKDLKKSAFAALIRRGSPTAFQIEGKAGIPSFEFARKNPKRAHAMLLASDMFKEGEDAEQSLNAFFDLNENSQALADSLPRTIFTGLDKKLVTESPGFLIAGQVFNNVPLLRTDTLLKYFLQEIREGTDVDWWSYDLVLGTAEVRLPKELQRTLHHRFTQLQLSPNEDEERREILRMLATIGHNFSDAKFVKECVHHGLWQSLAKNWSPGVEAELRKLWWSRESGDFECLRIITAYAMHQGMCRIHAESFLNEEIAELEAMEPADLKKRLGELEEFIAVPSLVFKERGSQECPKYLAINDPQKFKIALGISIPYPMGLSLLAERGDKESIKAIQDAAKDWRYRWMSDTDLIAKKFIARDIANYWVTQLESNCCSSATARYALEVTFRLNFDQGLILANLRSIAKFQVDQLTAPLRWSKIAEVFLPGK